MNQLLSFALLMTTQLLVGCGGGGATGGQPVFPASGTVTMFGKPLAQATVAFAPQGNQPTAIGTTDAEGNFKLTTYDFGDGAAEGSYKVVVSKAAGAAAAAAGDDGEEGADHDADDDAAGDHDGPEEGATTELVPQQYTTAADTPFSADVKSSGENSFTFEIK
ncbi:MAG: carboxypeptidase-like regulatory domain-containing protein [Fuerstiella sp.]